MTDPVPCSECGDRDETVAPVRITKQFDALLCATCGANENLLVHLAKEIEADA